MKDCVIIGLAVIGLGTLGVDYFILESLVPGDITEARQELWMKAGMLYLILLIPAFFMVDPQRREASANAAKASSKVLLSVANYLAVGGLVLLSVTKYLAVGVLLYIGWHLASNVFSII